LSLEDFTTPETEDIEIWLKEFKSTSDPKVKKQLKNLIILYYLPLVKKIAYGLARRNTDPIEDIIQVGSLGLIKAVDQFNNNYGASFKTYATYLITGEIRHYLRDKIAMIRAPRELHELSLRMHNISEILKIRMGRMPTELEIAQELQMPVHRINEIFEADRRKQLVSLDQLVFNNSEAEQSLVDRLVDNKYQVYQSLQEERMMLYDAVSTLPDSLKEVIRLSFFEDLNQSEIANKIGISQMQVSRRIKKATFELFKIISSQNKRVH
jgi:RNA polymerase sigma-B factor